jgi:hypothetical protein
MDGSFKILVFKGSLHLSFSFPLALQFLLFQLLFWIKMGSGRRVFNDTSYHVGMMDFELLLLPFLLQQTQINAIIYQIGMAIRHPCPFSTNRKEGGGTQF